MNGWDIAGGTFVALGVFFIVVSAVGLVRLPDVYSRLSAVTKAATLGVVLILAGACMLKPSWTAFATLALAAALQFITAPIGGFTLGRAAYRSKSPLAPQTKYDELATDDSAAPVAEDR